MALGLKSTVADSINNALLRNGTYTGVATLYMKLHTAPPGAAGTTSPAGNTSRQSTAWAVSSGGISLNSAPIVWTSVSTSETYTDFSLWDDPTAGNFVASGTIAANPVTALDTFTIAIGAASVTAPVAS